MSTDALPKKKNKTRPSTWRDDLPVHPAAELFPLMGEAELRELADDVEKHGLQEKPDIYRDENGKEFLLDGRNRVRRTRPDRPPRRSIQLFEQSR